MKVGRRFVALILTAGMAGALVQTPIGAAQAPRPSTTSPEGIAISTQVPLPAPAGVPGDPVSPTDQPDAVDPLEAAMRIEAAHDRLPTADDGGPVVAQRGDSTVVLPPDPASVTVPEPTVAAMPESVTVTLAADSVQATDPAQKAGQAEPTQLAVPDATTVAVGPSVSGVVTSGVSVPVEGATVTAHLYCGTDSPIATTTTAANGSYTLPLPVSYLSYSVRFSAPGKVAETFDDGSCVYFPTGSSQVYTNVNADLATAGSISGTVIREDAGALGTVTVTASTFGFSATTETTGAYSLPGLPPGVYTVYFSPSDLDVYDEYFNSTRVYQQSTFVTVTASALTSGIDASLTSRPAPGTLAGHVVDSSSNPVEAVDVTAYLRIVDPDYGYEYWDNTATTQTDVTGAYSLQLAPGTYRIEFSKAGYPLQYYNAISNFYTATTIPVASGATTTGIDATLLAPGTISGVVTGPGGTPLEGATVSFGTVSAGGYFSDYSYLGATTDVGGAYTLTDVPAGDWVVRFSKAGHIGEYWNNQLDASAAASVSVPPATNVSAIDAQLAAGGSISGTVSAAGLPLQDVLVFTCRLVAQTCAEYYSTITDISGNYAFTSLRSGQYTVGFNRYPYALEYYNNAPTFALATLVSVTAPNATSGIDAVLESGGGGGGTISGTVTGAGGLPLIFAYVSANGQSTSTDINGHYSFSSLPAGATFLSISATNYIPEYWSDVTDPLLATSIKVLAGGSTTADVQLAQIPAPSGATISGTATAPLGGSVQISFSRVGGPPNLGYQPYTQNLYAASGSPYSLTVTPGVYDVCFYGINTSQKCVRSQVLPAAVTNVSATLSLMATVTFAVTESSGLQTHSGYVSACYQYVDPDVSNPYGYDYCFFGGASQIVNGKGRANFEPGTYQFKASTSSGSKITPYITVASGNTTVNILMPSPVPNNAAISGVLRGPDGQPIGGVPVYGGTKETTTAADGSYLLSGLRAEPQLVNFGPYGTAPVPYRREAYRDDAQDSGSLLNPPAGGTLPDVNARLDPLTTVSGTGPVGKQVCVGLYFGYYYTDCTTIAVDGTFTIHTQPGQTVDLCEPNAACYEVNGSSNPIYIGWRAVSGLVVTSGTTGGGTITGSLTWPGDAPPPMQIYLQGAAGSANESYYDQTSANGSSYSFANVPPGSYTVTAVPTYGVRQFVAPSYYRAVGGTTTRVSQATAVPVTNGATTSGINIAVQRVGRLKVTITSGGVPVANSYLQTDGGLYSSYRERLAVGTSLVYASGDAMLSAWRVDSREAGPDATLSVIVTPGVETAVSIPLPTATRPGRPQSVVAAPGSGAASLTWVAPTSDGGAPVTGYVVQVIPAPLRQPATYNVVGTSTQIVGLTSGTQYVFSVSAVNSVGAGPPKGAQTIPTGCLGTPFTDVANGYVFCEAIDWMVGRGITTGFANSTFGPQQAINRDAMAAFLFRFAGEPTTPASTKCGPSVVGSGPFTDVAPTYVFCRAIEWMKQAGITNGYPDGSFKPQQPINRDAMSAFLFRFAGQPTSPASTSCGAGAATPGPFTDVSKTYQFCRAIEWMKQVGITTGFPDGSFKPQLPINRDAIAAFLFRFDDKNIAIG